MAFRENEYQQLSIEDSFHSLSEREKKFLERSWAKPFAEIIFPAILENDFSVLYSDKYSRPNTPVNVIMGALLLKEIHGLTDDEMVFALMFDVRYQYALHTTSYAEQPLSDRTLGRFRERCLKYEKKTGIDLIKNCILQLSEELTTVMGIDGTLKRMDSMMIASNIKRLSRFELIYSCVARFVKYLKNNSQEIPKDMTHYCNKDDYNKTVYHMRDIDINQRFEELLKDAKQLIDSYQREFSQSAHYQILVRVIKEQTVLKEDRLVLKEKSDYTMNSKMLQSPADPDATYRTKAGKGHQGYVANLTEDLGENCSIISDYDYQENTYSDSKFLKDSLEQLKENENEIILMADGAYSGTKNHEKAASCNVELVTTNFQGRKPPVILADFEFNEDGKKVLKCANGKTPKTSKYYSNSNNCRITMDKEVCNLCPYKDQCKPKFHKTKASKILSSKSVANAKQMQYMKTEEFKMYARIRNGVESLVSVLRRKYRVDTMPVRGKLRSKLYFSLKVGALNIKKLVAYLSSLDSCTQKKAIC